MNTSTVTITIDDRHECGHHLEQIIHLKLDESLSWTLSKDTVVFETSELSAFTMPVSSWTKINLQGTIERVELSGVEIRDYAMRCVRCGKNVLFPEPEKGQG